jgi:uncharacterized membrane protein
MKVAMGKTFENSRRSLTVQNNTRLNLAVLYLHHMESWLYAAIDVFSLWLTSIMEEIEPLHIRDVLKQRRHTV